MMKCALCPETEKLTTLDYPAIRLCSVCLEKLRTHLATVCEGCNTIWWTRKTPENIMQASRIHGVDPVHVRENQVIFGIKSCRGCYEAVKEFTQSVAWVQ